MKFTLSAFADEAADQMDGQIAALKDARIDHVDLRNVDGHNITVLPLDLARQVKQKLDAAGIAVGMYGSPIGKIDITDDFNIDVQKIEHLGELKKVFGATNVRLFSYWNKKGASEAEYRKESLRRLGELVKLAQKLDLVLYHENEVAVYGDTLEHVKVLRDEVHSKHPERFKLIFDSDNFNQCNQDVWTCWTTLRDDVEALHFKDSNKQPDGTFQHCPVGQGQGKYPQIVAEMAARNWSGPMTLEPHLARSAAVLATGPHGAANQSLADLTPYECFLVAAKEVRKLLAQHDK